MIYRLISVQLVGLLCVNLLACAVPDRIPIVTRTAAAAPARPVVAPAAKPVDRLAITIIPASDSLIERICALGETECRLFGRARRSIGVAYVWGGARPDSGIDCSNFTWQLFRSQNGPYERYMSTMVLSRIGAANGLKAITFEQARTGDLLVYGYRDANRKWHGHVVILIDRDGSLTGHRGLVLGAHGAPVSSVQFVTYRGFDQGYFKNPHIRLQNVLRVDRPQIARQLLFNGI